MNSNAGIDGMKACLFCLRTGGYAMQLAVWREEYIVIGSRTLSPFSVQGGKTLIEAAGEVGLSQGAVSWLMVLVLIRFVNSRSQYAT